MNNIKLLPLVNLKSVQAFCAYNNVLFGLHCSPAHLGKTDEQFYDWFDGLNETEKEKQLRFGLSLAKLSTEEMLDLACFASDENGIAFTEINLKKLNPIDILEILLAVCVAMSKIKVSSISEEQKKN